MFYVLIETINVYNDGMSETLVEPARTEHEQGERFRVEAFTSASEKHPARNEDAYFVSEKGWLGICDGMGGKPGSEAAAHIVAEYCEAAISQLPEQLTQRESSVAMAQIIRDAATALQMEYGGRDHDPIGTTATTARVFTDPTSGDKYLQAPYAGDTRAYVVREGRRIAVTLDHCYVSMPYSDTVRHEIQDAISASRYEHELDRSYRPYLGQLNIIGSCLLSHPGDRSIRVDTLTTKLQTGDIVLLTSDGIHDNLTDQEIVIGLRAGGVQSLVAQAQLRSRESRGEIYPKVSGKEIDSYNFRPKPDDMTAVALYI